MSIYNKNQVETNENIPLKDLLRVNCYIFKIIFYHIFLF